MTNPLIPMAIFSQGLRAVKDYAKLANLDPKVLEVEYHERTETARVASALESLKSNVVAFKWGGKTASGDNTSRPDVVNFLSFLDTAQENDKLDGLEFFEFDPGVYGLRWRHVETETPKKARKTGTRNGKPWVYSIGGFELGDISALNEWCSLHLTEEQWDAVKLCRKSPHKFNPSWAPGHKKDLWGALSFVDTAGKLKSGTSSLRTVHNMTRSR